MPTILLTGFGPFPGAAVNPTAALVRRLAMRRRAGFADLKLVAHVFPTSYAAVANELPTLLARYRPDAVLMFGLAQRTPHLRIETRARNAAYPVVADVHGKHAGSSRIEPGGPGLRGGRGPFHKLLASARGARVPVRLSFNAGGYLCNYLYWHALTANPGGKPPLVVFVHVPQLGTAHLPRGRSKRRHLSRSDLVRAGEALLVAIACGARARR